MRTPRRSVRAGWAAGLGAACIAAVLAFPGPVSAHTELIGTTPADGARLPRPPSEVVVRYSAPLTGIVDTEAELDGADVAGGPARLARTDAGRLRIPVDAGDRVGRLTVRWVVRASDAHPLAGDLSVSVAPAPQVALRRVAAALDEVARRLVAVVREVRS